MVILPLQVPGPAQAHSRRNGRRSVAGGKGVVLAFLRLGKAADSLPLAQGGKAVKPPGQQLIRVALMADIQKDFILGRAENPEYRDRQLHDAQVGGQVPAVLGNRLEDFLPDLLGQKIQLGSVQLFYICRRMNLFQ